MPDFIQLLSTLKEQMSAELTRSDVLRALIWPNAGLLIATVCASTTNTPSWILQILVIMLCGFMGLYALAFIFFAYKDPDALRSEKYKLHKMALEQGIFGNSISGLQEVKDITIERKLVVTAPGMDEKL